MFRIKWTKESDGVTFALVCCEENRKVLERVNKPKAQRVSLGVSKSKRAASGNCPANINFGFSQSF